MHCIERLKALWGEEKRERGHDWNCTCQKKGKKKHAANNQRKLKKRKNELLSEKTKRKDIKN